jgi:hypothetical protein
MKALVAATLVLLAAAPVSAQESPPLAPPRPGPYQGESKIEDVQHTASITISPFHLIAPIVELTGEYRLHDKIGAAVIGGFGSMGYKSTRYWVYEAGGQFRWYAIGSFIHGMEVGAEVLFAGVSGENVEGSGVTGVGQGLAVGPFLGYKIATNIGFTFDAQLGAQASFLHAAAGGSSASAVDFIPLLNLNIGWSF